MKKVRFSVLVFVSILSGVILARHSASAQQTLLPSKPDLINWVTGPARADLGGYAQIEIPEGFRFASAEDAKILLKSRNNPAPDSLVGILAPSSGKWFVIFQYAKSGYIRDDGRENLDAAAILKTVREKVLRQDEQTGNHGGDSIADVSWDLKPEYDRDQHTIEWAIRARTALGQTINHVVRVLGREGMLDGIAVQPQQTPSDTVPLKHIMAGVSFKPGHTYSDFHSGDKVSALGLADVITADESTMGADDSLTWKLSLAGIGVVAVALGFWIVRNGRQKASAASSDPSGIPLRASASDGSRDWNRTSDPARVNGKQNGNYKVRRKRVFDYQKYYSDLLFQVTDRAYGMDIADSRTSHGGLSDDREGKQTANSNESALSANLKLIESQKHLIEEQQRLIREQTRLIEEKTKLIQEKNQVLEKQSELFGNQVF